MSALFSKKMPPMVSGPQDRSGTFSAGRKAFFNNNFKSYDATNGTPANVNYKDVKNKITSNVFAKPLQNQSGALRAQRLRLTLTGSGSSQLKPSSNELSYFSANSNGEKNVVNNALTSVRGSGGGRPKYYKRS